MPQLNPAPWFATLIVTWAITLTLLKLMAPSKEPWAGEHATSPTPCSQQPSVKA